MRRTRMLVATALAAIALGVVAFAQPAAAANANAWVIVQNNNCRAGGSIINFSGVTVLPTGWVGGDYGDNILYPVVRLGVQNQMYGWAWCYRPWYKGGAYWINIIKYFTPTYPNQNIWL